MQTCRSRVTRLDQIALTRHARLLFWLKTLSIDTKSSAFLDFMAFHNSALRHADALHKKDTGDEEISRALGCFALLRWEISGYPSCCMTDTHLTRMHTSEHTQARALLRCTGQSPWPGPAGECSTPLRTRRCRRSTSARAASPSCSPVSVPPLTKTMEERFRWPPQSSRWSVKSRALLQFRCSRDIPSQSSQTSNNRRELRDGP